MDLLSTAAFFTIGFCLLMYVILDGIDLGVGILFALFRDHKDRSIMISSVLPIWDGNQTWLVFGGAALYGTFPLAFSLLLPALYVPLFMMITGLLFRGVIFEFRLKAEKLKGWDILFFLSSATVTFSQGLILGTFVKGFSYLPGTHILTYDSLFTAFNITCGLSLIVGYALLGATWLIAKTSGTLQERMFVLAEKCLFIITVALIVISLWTPFIDARIKEIWFNPQHIYQLALLPLATGILILYCTYCFIQRRERILFWLAIGIFFCSYAGFGISTWPYIVPHLVSYQAAAAPHLTLGIILLGVVILLPILLGYTLYSYYIFRGKVTEVIGY